MATMLSTYHSLSRRTIEEAVGPAGLVGPNTVTQLIAALDRLAPTEKICVFAVAGQTDLLLSPPTSLIDERVPAALFAALRATVCPTKAWQVSWLAGSLTADYVIANRVPAPARWALPRLPQGLSARLLLKAIERSAWTFAGSGHCSVSLDPLTITIDANPLAAPGCPWHRAVLQRMFQRLVHREADVRHSACCRTGAPACRFDISLPAPHCAGEE